MAASVLNTPVVLLDIEGTTSSVDFVYQTLFPFARAHLRAFVEGLPTGSASEPSLDSLRAAFEAQARLDRDAGVAHPEPLPADASLDALRAWVVASALAHMDGDRKTTALKDLQGHVWEQGYRDGLLQGHVYPDVPAAFARWVEAGRRIHIYSSGSIRAQQLIFGHSVEGDLTRWIDGYFDTTTGPKRVPASYATIAGAIGVTPSSVCFFTDVVEEAEAARAAGMAVVVVRRPGDPSPRPTDFAVVEDFEGL
jgi:enolase-phosphatase E1